jgi:hypothetical protein
MSTTTLQAVTSLQVGVALPFEVINDMVAPQDWETLVSAGIMAVERMDGFRWLLGDLALVVERVYGKSSLKRFAADIRLPRHRTLYDYQAVAAFYPNSARAEFQSLTWSHYRAVQRRVSQATSLHYAASVLDEARHWLAQAEDGVDEKGSWPVARLDQELQQVYSPQARASVVVRAAAILSAVPCSTGGRIGVDGFIFRLDRTIIEALHRLHFEGKGGKLEMTLTWRQNE